MLRTLVFLATACPVGMALADGHAVAFKAGALGVGAEYAYAFSERWTLRTGAYGSQIGVDADAAGIDYEFDVLWDSVAVGVDFHPRRSPLRFSLGLLKNDNALRAIARLSGNVEIGDSSYTPAEVGTLATRIGFEDTASFAGLGWDWSRRRERFGVSLDLGLIDQGQPTVRLTASGPLLSDPGFAADLAAEELQLSADAADLDVLPFLTFGLVFRF